MRFEIDIDVPRGLESFAEAAVGYYEDALQVLVDRQHKYGPRNIARAGLVGLLTRCEDKTARMEEQVLWGVTCDDEGDHDPYIDRANYDIIARMVKDGVWPLPAPATLDEYLGLPAGTMARVKREAESGESGPVTISGTWGGDVEVRCSTCADLDDSCHAGCGCDDPDDEYIPFTDPRSGCPYCGSQCIQEWSDYEEAERMNRCPSCGCIWKVRG